MRLNQSKYLNYLLRIIDGIKLTPSAWAGPVHLQIEPVSGICNLNCRICDTRSKEKKELSLVDFKRILDSFPFCMELKLTGNGESLMVRDFFKMIEYAKLKNIKVSFYTNMTLVDEGTAKRLIELSVDEIFISIDSSYPELFERIRRGASYTVVVENIKRLNQLKKEYNSVYPELYFGSVAMKKNIDGIPDLVRLASELNIKGVVVHHLGIKDAEMAKPEQGFMDNPSIALYYFRKAEQIAKSNGLTFNYPLFDLKKMNPSITPRLKSRGIIKGHTEPPPSIRGRRNEKTILEAPPSIRGRRNEKTILEAPPLIRAIQRFNNKFLSQSLKGNSAVLRRECIKRFNICQQPWVNCQVDPWGNIYPCCRLRQSFGNIFKQQFSSIWNGEGYRRLRRLVAAGRLPCPQCEASISSLR